MAFLDNIKGGIFGSSGGDSQNYLKNIGNQTKPLYNPYMKAGQSAIPEWQRQMLTLTQNPAEFLNNLGQGFQQSPGFQFNVDQATKAAMNAGAASGMAGSPAVMDALAKQITGYANQDYNNWMQQALGQYNLGFGGLQNLSQLGLGATNSFADILKQQMMAQAELEAARAASQANATGGLMGGALSMVSKIPGLGWLG